ncbi:MAG: glycosyltransferase [Clostridia bacterium]|nr:glycosyltransferase [Clostridia bacterium]
MKILQINAVYGIGSTGMIIKDLHELALEHGHESYVAYSVSNVPADKIKNGYKVGRVFGKKLHALLYRIGGKQAYFSRFSTQKLIKYIKNINPDIVNLHNLHSNYLYLNKLLEFLAEAKIKTVITHHDCWFYTGGCFHYTEIGCDKWQKKCGDCPKRMTDLAAYLTENSAAVLADRKKYFGAVEDLTCLCVSDWLKEELQKSFFKNRPLVTVKNGIDMDFFTDTPSDLREQLGLQKKFVILGLASKFFNGVNRETYETLVSNLAEDEVLVLLGCSQKQKKNLPDQVIGLDFIKDRNLLRQVYSMADVFANCSREETLSMATVEPQACGTPAVVYGNTGIKETVCDGKTGYVVKNGDAEGFSAAIKKIKGLGKSYFKANCREWALQNFDRNKNYLEVFKLYEEIMREHIQ